MPAKPGWLESRMFGGRLLRALLCVVSWKLTGWRIMRKRLVLAFVVATLLAVASPAAMAGNLVRATGAARIFEGRQFVFNAVELPNGTVVGQGRLVWPEYDINVRFTVDCLSVEGDTATIGGQVTSSNIEWVGPSVWFRVVDNGRPNSSPADQMTFLNFEDETAEEELPWPDNCESDVIPYWGEPFDVIRGNVRVRG